MKTRMLLLLGCLLALASNAQAPTKRELWVWKDANGVTHYSDVPAPGAKKMEIMGATTVAPPPSPAADQRPASKAEAVQYTELDITSPENDATFFGAETVVEIKLRSTPELANGDVLSLYLDGNLVSGAQNAYEYKFSNLPRGAHSVIAVIRDAQGNEKIRSSSHAFNIRQTVVENPRNVGPALKPKPAPLPAPPPAPPKSPK